MAVALRSSTGVIYTSRTNTTLTAPSGIQDGDILVMYFLLGLNNATPPSITFPTGFSSVPGPTFPVSVTDGSGFYVHNYIRYKVASSESGNYTITHAANSTQGWIGAASGADSTTPFGQNATSNSTNKVGAVNLHNQSQTTATGITTTRSSCLIIFTSQDWGDTSLNLTGPTSFTKQFGSTSTAGILYVSTLQQAIAGATGNESASNNSWCNGTGYTTNTDPWSGFLIAIQPPPCPPLPLLGVGCGISVVKALSENPTIDRRNLIGGRLVDALRS